MAPAAAAQGVKPRAALNPAFTWDGGADAPAPAVQPAWDFKGAPKLTPAALEPRRAHLCACNAVTKAGP